MFLLLLSNTLEMFFFFLRGILFSRTFCAVEYLRPCVVRLYPDFET